MINKIKNKLIKLRLNFARTIPEEREARRELITSMSDQPIDIDCKDGWGKYRQRIRQYFTTQDIRNFLRWEPIISSMFHNAKKAEFDYLTTHDWGKWENAIIESWIGNPPPYSFFKKTSGNIVHTAYNLAQLLDHYPKLKIGTVKNIIEFGAGYGCMSKLTHTLGFRGKYSIFDIPEFLALQKYYLRSTKTIGEITFSDQVKNIDVKNPDILIATWSLSESPLSTRNEFLKKIGQPKYILIAYQANFESIDNEKYFDSYQKNNPGYAWVKYEIKHLPNNYYLIGERIHHDNC